MTVPLRGAWVVAAWVALTPGLFALQVKPAGDSSFATASRLITADLMRRHASELASDAYEGRGGGYPGERRAAAYVVRQFERMGLAPQGDSVSGRPGWLQEFLFPAQGPVTPFQVLASENVLGFWEGSDPRLRAEIIVVGAHHDGQGKFGEADGGRSLPKGGVAADSIWNSADDNVSGLTTMLAVAEALTAAGVRPKRSILFASWGAEEQGLIGSITYVNRPRFPWRSHVAAVTFEQMGRHPELDPIATATGTSPAWSAILARANQLTGVSVKAYTPGVIQDSDHYAFAVRGVPAIAIGVAHDDDIHLPSDTWEKFDFPAFAGRARFALALVLELADRDRRPPYAGRKPCTGKALGESDWARCSTIFDPGIELAAASAAELDSARVGAPAGALKVMVMVAGLPAARSGLAPGDLILAIGGRVVPRTGGPQLVRRALDRARGASVRLEVLRAGCRVSVTIGPARA